MNTATFPYRVYYVSSPDDDTALIALDININDDGDMRWFDTIKERIMRVGEIVDSSPEHFVFQRNDGEAKGVYTFTPMTLDTYNEKVKSRILIPQGFMSEDQMLQAFEKTRDNAW